jgi:hypothetical protein
MDVVVGRGNALRLEDAEIGIDGAGTRRDPSQLVTSHTCHTCLISKI